ncbi:MAG TPA: fibronectin type III domain-containing protein, partial [Acetobacteraceae bacterium]
MIASGIPVTPIPLLANPPGGPALAQGSGSSLTVTWTAPAIDSTHGAAAGFNLRFSPSGAAAWTMVPGVTSPYVLSGLTAGALFDVQLQSSNAAGVSAWSATSTLTTGTAAPNTPGAASLAQGPGTGLTVTWTAPAVDTTHGTATGFNLRSSPSGAGTWTTVTGVISPYNLSG